MAFATTEWVGTVRPNNVLEMHRFLVTSGIEGQVNTCRVCTNVPWTLSTREPEKMSIRIKSRWKEWAQSLLGVAVLFVFLWICRPGLFTHGSSDGGAMNLFGLATAGDGESCRVDCDSNDKLEELEGQSEYDQILAMPACVDLGNAIDALLACRNRLLEAVVNEDAQATLAATAEYRKAAQAVQEKLATFKMRVAPDEFPDVLQDFFAAYAMEDGLTLMPCELGPFAEDIDQ